MTSSKKDVITYRLRKNTTMLCLITLEN